MAETKPTTSATASDKPAQNGPATPPAAPAAPAAPFNFNDLVKKAEVIEGFDIMDKAELIGVEFVITGVWFASGARNVGYAYMNGVKRDGSKFTFNDSSSGIKAQITDMMTKMGKSTAYDTGEVLEVLIHIPRGVRVSEYEIKDVNNKDRKARTYYLTTGGQ
jgi:hypothetical protein